MATKQIKVSGLMSSGVIKQQAQNSENEPKSQEIIVSADNTSTNDPSAPSNTIELLLDLIDDSPYQPRLRYASETIDELAHTMASAGQEEPIQVRVVGSRYELISGHRRVRAGRSLGWITIKASIVVKDDREAELATMVHNEGREDLSDFERGKLYKRAQTGGFAKSQTEIANLFGTSQAVVSKRLAMLELPKAILELLEANPILFSYNCSNTIHSLLKEYPDHIKLIEDATRRLVEGADQNSIRGWVEQMIGIKDRRAKISTKKVITNDSGKQLFTTTFDGKTVVIRISDPTVDVSMVQQKVSDTLTAIARIDTMAE